MNDKRITTNLIWKLLERFSVQLVQFVLQMLLARLLSPQHYGELAIMVVFTNLATVFIQAGLNVSLIQNKDVSDNDFSSVFWVSFGIAIGLYGLLFFAIPSIANFYEMVEMIVPFRVLALMLLPGAFNAIQLAKASREMNFRLIFISNFVSVGLSGCVAIVIAFLGGGIWSLVIMNLLHMLLACLIMLASVKWYPRAVFEFSRVKVLFSYGWKLMTAYLIDTLYQDLRSLIIGKKYTSSTLGYYNRGNQFPQFIISAVSSSVQSVLLPAMSRKQSKEAELKQLLRQSVELSAYIISPLMVGLAVVAPELVVVLLGNKWLPSVPFLRICSIAFMFRPIGACILSTINAIGRSDMFLKLELIKKAIDVTALIFVVVIFNSPVAIAVSFAASMLLDLIVSCLFAQRLMEYSWREQATDILPSFGAALGMGALLLPVSFLKLSAWLMLMVLILCGILIYVGISTLFHLNSFVYVLTLIKAFFSKRKNDSREA